MLFSFRQVLYHTLVLKDINFLFSAIHLPYCHTPESYRHTEKVAEMLFFFGQWNPNQCNCPQQCMKMLYTSSLESTTDRFKITKGRTKARVRIYYQVRNESFCQMISKKHNFHKNLKKLLHSFIEEMNGILQKIRHLARTHLM